MCGIGLMLGMFGIFAASRLIWRLRRGGWGPGGGHHRFGHHGPFGGGWHRGGHADHDGYDDRGDERHGFGPRGGRGRGWSGLSMRWLARELELNPRQREEVEGVLDEIRGATSAVRGLDGDLGALAHAFGDDTLDKARIDEVAQKRAEAMTAASKVIVDGLDHLHAVLIPEQRRKLRDLLARLSHTPQSPAAQA